MIDQLTVFLSNEPGRLTALARALGDAGINMHALTVADTSEYGVVRIVCDDPKLAVEKLTEAGFRAMTNKIVAVEVPDRPGGLAELLETLSADPSMSIEYSYCFSKPATGAIDALKAPEGAEEILANAGYHVLKPEELYKLG